MQNFLKKSSGHVSVFLNDDTFRLVHADVSPGPQVRQVIAHDIKGMTGEDLSASIRAALAGLKVKDVHTILVIPASVTTTKNIEIPSLETEEIRSIVKLQAGRHTPYSRDEIIISYVRIGVYQNNYSKILLVIANRNLIKGHLYALETAGLNIDQILFAPESIARFYSKVMKSSNDEAPRGIIDVMADSTTFLIARKGSVITCRSIPVGLNQLSAQQQTAREKLISELANSVESYKSEDIDQIPTTYFLTDDNDQTKDLPGLLKEALKAEVKIVSYLEHVKGGGLIREKKQDSYLDIVASCVTSKNAEVNLMPEEVEMQKSIAAKSREAIKMGILTTFFMILFCFFFFSKIYYKSAFLERLIQDYQNQRSEVEALEKTSMKSRIVKDFLGGRMLGLNVIDALYGVIPDEIFLENIRLEENGTIDIRGTSESMSRVFALVTALEESELFKNVKTKSTTAKKLKGKDVALFEIAFKLESAKEETSVAGEPGGAPAE